MKGLGLVLALSKKMATCDEISITETETDCATGSEGCCAAELSYFVPGLGGWGADGWGRGAHQASLPMSICRHAVTSEESGPMDQNWQRNWHIGSVKHTSSGPPASQGTIM